MNKKAIILSILLIGIFGQFFFVNAETIDDKIPVREIYGRVFNQNTNEAIGNAKVSLINDKGEFVKTDNNPFTTSDDGNYSFTVKPGVYKLEVEVANFLKSTIGGVDLEIVSNSESKAVNDVSGYFYISGEKVNIDIPLLPVNNELYDLYNSGKTLYINPNGDLSESCTIPPIITDISPIPNSLVQNLFPTLSFNVLRGDPSIEGVDKKCIKVILNNEDITKNLVITGDPKKYHVEYPFEKEALDENIVHIEACDLNSPTPNRAKKDSVFYTYLSEELKHALNLDNQLNKISGLIATGTPIGISFLLLIAIFGIYKLKKNNE